jgi:hypothetical protein
VRHRTCRGHALKRRYPKSRAQLRKFAIVMHEWGKGSLRTPQGKRVKSHKQAVAIALNVARKVR